MHGFFVADVSISVHMQHNTRMIGRGLDSRLLWKKHSLATDETESRQLLYQYLNLISLWCLHPQQLQPAEVVWHGNGISLETLLSIRCSPAHLSLHPLADAICSNICCMGSVSPGLDHTSFSRTERLPWLERGVLTAPCFSVKNKPLLEQTQNAVSGDALLYSAVGVSSAAP